MNHKQEISAYFDGVRRGITQYAHWAEGVQYVGTTGKKLSTAINEIDLEEQEYIKQYEQSI
jgi:hypothetical protein